MDLQVHLDRARPADYVLDVATRVGADLVVMGSVARTGEWVLPAGVPEAIWGIVAVGWLLSFWRDAGETPEPV